ncbi:hypothetical protein [Helicobacter sp. T3_23-1056]
MIFSVLGLGYKNKQDLGFWSGFYFPLPCGGVRGWVSCHTERSEVSLKSTHRDISFSTKTQYDKETSVIASSLDSLESKLRGNLWFLH